MLEILGKIKNVTKHGIVSETSFVFVSAYTCAFAFLVFATPVNAEVMSSSNYKMESDSLNFGGSRSSSSMYSAEDTLGESATGYSSSTNYLLSAGYQQPSVVFISVAPAANIVMSPNISTTGGVSDGSTQFSVSTNNPAGYTVTISAENSPALVSAHDAFMDYVPSTSEPDYSFTNNSASSSFGFSPEGDDVATRFRNDGSSCGTGSNTSRGCWDGLSTSPKIIVSRLSSNNPAGTATTLMFKAESGSARNQEAGTYVATTTLTVIAL